MRNSTHSFCNQSLIQMRTGGTSTVSNEEVFNIDQPRFVPTHVTSIQNISSSGCTQSSLYQITNNRLKTHKHPGM
jgi:hypothetical protein